MQTNHIDLYKDIAAHKGGTEQIYKDIGSFIFKETSRMMKNPSSLIIKLKGIGNWHLRKKRMEIVVNEWTDRAKIKTREDFTSDVGYNNYLEKHTQYINFTERLKEYEKYLEIKKGIREIRNESQVLLIPNNDEKFKSE